MATVTVTNDNIESHVTGNDIVILDYWADWCGPCKLFAPIFEEASNQHQDIVFGKIDTQDQQQLSAGAGIQSIPTVQIFREQILLYSQPGALPAAALDELIRKISELDMAAVRAQIAKREAEMAASGGASSDRGPGGVSSR
jgi:thioredoxin 1